MSWWSSRRNDGEHTQTVVHRPPTERRSAPSSPFCVFSSSPSPSSSARRAAPVASTPVSERKYETERADSLTTNAERGGGNAHLVLFVLFVLLVLLAALGVRALRLALQRLRRRALACLLSLKLLLPRRQRVHLARVTLVLARRCAPAPVALLRRFSARLVRTLPKPRTTCTPSIPPSVEAG